MNQKAPFNISDLTVPLEEWLSEGCIFSLSPDKLFIGWGKAVWSSEIQPSSPHWFYFPDYFADSPTSWVTFPQYQILSPAQLNFIINSTCTPPRIPLRWNDPLKRPFQDGFDHLQPLFANGSLKKVVLYTSIHSHDRYTSTHLLQSLRSFCEQLKSSTAFLYGFWDRTSGTLGATPELLFRLSGETHLETMALAGTQKSDTPHPPMDQNRKLITEHAIVVEDICKQLTDLGSINKGELGVMTLPRLSHLYTPITVHIERRESFEKIVQRLHPTPALGGYPRDTALCWLREYQKKIPRGRFGAPVGYQNSETKEQICYVGIRNGTWNDRGISILAGCGIIPESSFEEEWEEALLKIHAIKGFLKV